MLITTSIILICLAAAVILIIVVKKFPAMAILDVANIPGEKEAKFKEQIIKARVERDLSRWTGFIGRFWLFLSKQVSAFLQARQASLKKVKVNYKVSLKMPWLEKQKQIRKLWAEAEEAAGKEDEAAAEEKLVEIISLDQKNLDAFFKLAGLYDNQKKWIEARQTYEYALKLARQSKDKDDIRGDIGAQEVHFALAKVEREAGDLDEALENIREALEIEPNNPRYLDLILDLSIIRKDKNLAQECLGKLAAVNPENQKLEEWGEKIKNL
jgi:tetratricopeptide (TPR) repeat protein